MGYLQSLSLVLISLAGASLAYFVKNFFFEPFFRFRETVGKVRNRLKYYSNIITSPPGFGAPDFAMEDASEASRACRELSCELEERYAALAFRNLLIKAAKIPTQGENDDAARALIFLSNSTRYGDSDDNAMMLRKISHDLGFHER